MFSKSFYRDGKPARHVIRPTFFEQAQVRKLLATTNYRAALVWVTLKEILGISSTFADMGDTHTERERERESTDHMIYDIYFLARIWSP